MIPHRSLDCVEGFVGARYMGKTHQAVARLRGLRGRGYLLVHDPQHQIDSPIIAHDIGEAYEHVYKGRTGDLIVCRVRDARQVILCARTIAATALREAKRKQPGIENPIVHPTYLYIDEAVLALDISPNRLSPEAAELFTQCRHEHIGVLWGTQSPNRVHYELIALSTRMAFFRCPGGHAAARMREACIPEDVIRAVARLPRHNYIVTRPGALEGQSQLVECKCGADHSDPAYF